MSTSRSWPHLEHVLSESSPVRQDVRLIFGILLRNDNYPESKPGANIIVEHQISNLNSCQCYRLVLLGYATVRLHKIRAKKTGPTY